MAVPAIVGSEATTHLAMLMSNLYAPTEQAKAAFEELGVSMYDETTGMQKDVNTAVDEINAKLNEIKLSDPTNGEKRVSDLKSIIFGQRGEKAFNKMITSSAEKVQGFYDGLEYNEDGALGSAALQADVMLDNLAGQKTLLDSALEGLYNSIYKSMNDGLIDLVKLANDYVTQLTDAFIDGGFDGLAETFSVVLSQALGEISKLLPEIVEIGSSAMASFVKGFTENSESITDAAISIVLTLFEGMGNIKAGMITLLGEIFKAITSGISEHLDEIVDTGKTVLQTIITAISGGLPDLIETGISIIEMLAQVIDENLDSLVSAGLQLIQVLCDTLLTGENLERLLNAGIKILWAIANAILDNLDALVDIAVQIITFLAEELLKPDNINDIAEAAVDILCALTDGIDENLDELLLACELIVGTILDFLFEPENISRFLEIGTKWLSKLIEGFCDIGGKLVGWVVMMVAELGQTIAQTDWEKLGKSILDGILTGLLGVDADFYDFLDGFKKYTDEHGGGGSGTTNYNALSNRPKINGVMLTGDKSLDDLGIQAEKVDPLTEEQMEALKNLID